jgi:hypothetical protein
MKAYLEDKGFIIVTGSLVPSGAPSQVEYILWWVYVICTPLFPSPYARIFVEEKVVERISI